MRRRPYWDTRPPRQTAPRPSLRCRLLGHTPVVVRFDRAVCTRCPVTWGAP